MSSLLSKWLEGVIFKSTSKVFSFDEFLFLYLLISEAFGIGIN